MMSVGRAVGRWDAMKSRGRGAANTPSMGVTCTPKKTEDGPRTTGRAEHVIDAGRFGGSPGRLPAISMAKRTRDLDPQPASHFRGPVGATGFVGGRVAGTLGSTLIIVLLGLASGALVARMLGVDGRGDLAAIVLWPSIIAYVGDLGGPLAVAYLAAVRPAERVRLVQVALGTALAQSAILVVVGVPVVMVGLARYPGEVPLGLVLLAGFLPLNLATRYLNALHQGAGSFRRFNGVRLAVNGSYVAGVVVLFIAGAHSVGPVVAFVLASNVVALCAAARGCSRAELTPALDAGLMRDIFQYGLRGHIGNLTPIDSMQLDLLAVVVLLGAHDAGLYSVAASAALIVRGQATALGMVTLPTVAAARTKMERVVAAERLFRLGLALTVGLAAAIVASAPWTVGIVYGPEFGEAVPLVQVLGAGIVAASLRQVLGDGLRGLGQPLQGTIAELASLLAASVGLVLLVPAIGAMGAALAVSFAYAVALVVLIILAARAGIRPLELVHFRMADVRDVRDVLRALVPQRVRPAVQPDGADS
jgi:O-antigen/teichoic acid export membrane protein